MDIAPVIVGVDGSEASRAALAWAAEYAERVGAELVAVTAYDVGPYYGYPVPELDEDLCASAKKALQQAVAEVLGEDSGIDLRVERGQAAPILIRLGRAASLLVVGTRGRGAFAGMLLGSVSQHCVQQAPCPVVVIPQTTSAA